MSDPASIKLDFEGRRATLTLDRPPLNVLDLEALAGLEQATAELARRHPQTVLVCGSERAFSAGVSIHDHTPEKIEPMLGRFHRALLTLYRLDAVTVAAVRGPCLGGGMELAAACDLVIAAEGSRFGQPEIDVGCYPPFAAALYPTLLGPAIAADLVLTGRLLDAAEAQRLGFVSRLVSPEDFDAEVERLLALLESKSAAALQLAKRALRTGRGTQLEPALAECERLYLETLSQTEDLLEGVGAFIEKRAPRWQHR